MNALQSEDSGFIQPTWKYAVVIWWAWLWRWLLVSLIGVSCAVLLYSLVVAFVHTYISPPDFYEEATHPPLFVTAPYLLICLFAQVWSFQSVLKKKTFKKFSIRLHKGS